MGIEIERKFVVTMPDIISTAGHFQHTWQGYLAESDRAITRLRNGDKGCFLTIKGKRAGTCRPEFEYEIPHKDVIAMEELCYASLEKTRYYIPYQYNDKNYQLTWEVDVFKGDNQGLIIAELEIPSSTFEITTPIWVGDEVTDDIRYYNAQLAVNPFCNWGK